MPHVEEPAPGRRGQLVFKVADRPEELEQLHRLNWRTFVREVPQHIDPGDGQLVDKFHDKNLYFVALVDGRVVGMLAVHDQPPFSIEEKLADPSVLRSLGPRPLEVRLLAVEPEHRHSLVLGGLGSTMLKHARAQGYSHLLISGFMDRLRMYERMGFRALGPPVRNGAVDFVPMVAHVDRMPEHIQENAERLVRRLAPPVRRMAFTPGHACNAPDVLAAAARPWVDHRGPEFLSAYEDVLARLADLAGGTDVALFTGSGTLANDVVAWTLASDRRLRRGLVLVNGEFGRRIAAQARRAGLQTTVLAWDWGKPWDLALVERTLEQDNRLDWVWGVQLESSTGMLNDVGALLELLRKRRVRAVLDAVSGFGAVPLDLSRVHLASGVANKALGGVAGLSFVHAARGALDGVDGGHVPSTLDLREALVTRGPRFTMGGGPLFALHAALERYADGAPRRGHFAGYLELGRTVRARLAGIGLPAMVDDARAAPTITTFAPPPERRAALLAAADAAGFTLGGGSAYLRERGWLQIATMGDVTLADVERLFAALPQAAAG
jgi:aspartate aminotransferase-like enzyme/predicted N-acetyltransferase YhbS